MQGNWWHGVICLNYARWGIMWNQVPCPWGRSIGGPRRGQHWQHLGLYRSGLREQLCLGSRSGKKTPVWEHPLVITVPLFFHNSHIKNTQSQTQQRKKNLALISTVNLVLSISWWGGMFEDMVAQDSLCESCSSWTGVKAEGVALHVPERLRRHLRALWEHSSSILKNIHSGDIQSSQTINLLYRKRKHLFYSL